MPRCRICTDRLILPYTQCAECNGVNICLSCFAQGSHTTVHSAKHKYKVIHGGIAVTSKSWTGTQDLQLLTAIQEYGLGNWESIATLVPTKTEAECTSHFYNYFVNKPQKSLSIHDDTKYKSVAINNTSGGTRDPALFPLKVMSAKRGDWEHEYVYKNKAEEDFLFGEGGSKIVEALQVGIMEKYRLVQRKRNLLTNLMDEHGAVLLEHQPPPDPSESPTRNDKKVIEIRDGDAPFPKTSILKMCRFLTKDRLTSICESHSKISELRKSIKRLQDGRKLGIKSHYGVELHQKLKEKRAVPQRSYTKSVRDIYYRPNTATTVRRRDVCTWLAGITDKL